MLTLLMACGKGNRVAVRRASFAAFIRRTCLKTLRSSAITPGGVPQSLSCVSEVLMNLKSELFRGRSVCAAASRYCHECTTWAVLQNLNEMAQVQEDIQHRTWLILESCSTAGLLCRHSRSSCFSCKTCREPSGSLSLLGCSVKMDQWVHNVAASQATKSLHPHRQKTFLHIQ